VLSIKCNKFLELPEEIGGLVKLCVLDLYQSRALKSLPPSCSRLVCLERLCLSECNSLKTCPEVVGQLVGLTHLDLSGNLFTQLPESLDNLSRLRALDLSYCYKLVSFPFSPSRLPWLRVLKTKGVAFKQG
jgi:Leucine-rich repeat (LRR) protein